MIKKGVRQLQLTGLLLLVLLCIGCFAKFPLLVEQFYSKKIFHLSAIFGQMLFGFLPFSFGDVIYLLLFLLFIFSFLSIVKNLWRKKYLKVGMLLVRIVNSLLLIAVVFYLFWGLNYFRIPLEKRMALDMDIKASCELLETTALCIDKANEYRALLNKEDWQRSDQDIFHKASELLSSTHTLKQYIFIYQPSVKKPITNMHVNYTMVAGYFNPFTQEAHVNTAMPLFAKPFTACHELGHQAGTGFEDEANLIGFVLCTESDDNLFRYSAYYHAMFMLLNQVFWEDQRSYLCLLKLISPEVKKDAELEHTFWQQYNGVLNRASSKFYSGYLQVNNQPEGLRRYNRMTKLLIAWKKKYFLP